MVNPAGSQVSDVEKASAPRPARCLAWLHPAPDGSFSAATPDDQGDLICRMAELQRLLPEADKWSGLAERVASGRESLQRRELQDMRRRA